LGGAFPFLLGALVTLVAVFAGVFLARSQERSRRAGARRAAATALLTELRGIDATLRRVVERGSSAYDQRLGHPVLEAAFRDLTLFQAATAGRIAELHNHLRGLHHEVAQLRENPRQWTGRMAEFEELVKARAAAACRLVPELGKALHAEGGSVPPAPEARSPGELPPTPFGNSEGDDWTF
jgi:hypothetical protein